MLRRPSLHWVRGEDAQQCVDPRTLSERVEELVGPVLVRAPEAEHSVEARVWRPAQGLLRVDVRVLNAAGAKLGERSFEQQRARCPELTPAIAFVIAMMIDPDVAAHGLPPPLLALLGVDRPEEELRRDLEATSPPPPPPPPSPSPSRPSVPPSPASSEVRAPPAPALSSHQVALLARAAWHETARAALGVEARYAQVALRPWFAAAGYLRFGSQLGDYAVSTGGSLSLRTFALGVQGCAGQTSASRLRVLGCAGVELGRAVGTGSGFAPNRHQVLVQAGLVAQLTARMRVANRVGVMLAVNARVAFAGREFTYEADGHEVTAYRIPVFSGGLALGPSYEF